VLQLPKQEPASQTMNLFGPNKCTKNRLNISAANERFYLKNMKSESLFLTIARGRKFGGSVGHAENLQYAYSVGTLNVCIIKYLTITAHNCICMISSIEQLWMITQSVSRIRCSCLSNFLINTSV